MYAGASLMVQMVKNLPAMWETPIRFLGQEDPLEKEMATHSRGEGRAGEGVRVRPFEIP